jgi:hypothetical protein
MTGDGWVTLAEFETAAPAYFVGNRLAEEGVPHRVVGDLPRGGPTHWIWVPPEWKERAEKLMSVPAVNEVELDREALSYPPPDDL